MRFARAGKCPPPRMPSEGSGVFSKCATAIEPSPMVDRLRKSRRVWLGMLLHVRFTHCGTLRCGTFASLTVVRSAFGHSLHLLYRRWDPSLCSGCHAGPKEGGAPSFTYERRRFNRGDLPEWSRIQQLPIPCRGHRLEPPHLWHPERSEGSHRLLN